MSYNTQEMSEIRVSSKIDATPLTETPNLNARIFKVFFFCSKFSLFLLKSFENFQLTLRI